MSPIPTSVLYPFFFFKLLMTQKVLLVFWVSHALPFSSSVLTPSSPPLTRPLLSPLSLYSCTVYISNPSHVQFHFFEDIFPESWGWQDFHRHLNGDGSSSVWNLWHLSPWTLCFCKPSYSKLLGSRICILINLFIPFWAMYRVINKKWINWLICHSLVIGILNLRALINGRYSPILENYQKVWELGRMDIC